MKYRKRPVVIEAFQVGTLPPKWFEESGCYIEFKNQPSRPYAIRTPEGYTVADHGDWIIKGIQGELYCCRDSVFQSSYEMVDE